MVVLYLKAFIKFNYLKITRCATKNDRIRVLDDNLMVLISESLANQDQKTSCTSRLYSKALGKKESIN